MQILGRINVEWTMRFLTLFMFTFVASCHGNAADTVDSSPEDGTISTDLIELPDVDALAQSPIALTPNPLSFQACEMGESRDRDVLVRNTTPDPVFITQVESVGYGFFLEDSTRLPIQIDPMNTATITLLFSPIRQGLHESYVMIFTGETFEPYYLRVKGNGITEPTCPPDCFRP